MPDTGVFSFQVNERIFPVEKTPELVKYLQQFKGGAPKVHLLGGENMKASLPGDVARTIFGMLWSGEDPVQTFLHQAEAERCKAAVRS